MNFVFYFHLLLRSRSSLRLLLVAYLMLSGLNTSQSPAQTIDFLVAEWPSSEVHHDSYVLSLSDADDIAHARLLISAGPQAGSPIVVTGIAAGADGINRNVLADGEPLWSWHLTEFSGFADNTIEILDGWPGFVEQDVQGWIDNTNGAIGFWNYTVVAELIPVPEPSGLMLLGLGTIILLPTVRRYSAKVG